MIGLIVAYAKNRVIGNKGNIPWNIEGEMTRFRELTTGNIVVMGRRTYEEIGRPLPNRVNIVISRTKRFEGNDLYTVESLDAALELAKTLDQLDGVKRNIYLSGGAGVYKEGLHLCEKLYITEIEAEPEGDTFFPEFNEARYIKTVDKRVEGEIPYTYVTYTKKG